MSKMCPFFLFVWSSTVTKRFDFLSFLVRPNLQRWTGFDLLIIFLVSEGLVARGLYSSNQTVWSQWSFWKKIRPIFLIFPVLGKMTHMCICGKYYKYTCGTHIVGSRTVVRIHVYLCWIMQMFCPGKKSLEEVLDATTSSVSHVSQSRQLRLVWFGRL